MAFNVFVKVVLIKGVSGIGKSAIMLQLQRHASKHR